MGELVSLESKEQAVTNVPDELVRLVDLALRKYIPLHELAQTLTQYSSDRIKAYRVKQELPKRVKALKKEVESNQFGLTARIEYDNDPKVKKHRQDLWIKFIEVTGYAPCKVELHFDFHNTGINEGIAKRLDWAHLFVDCYASGQFWGESHEAVVLPRWLYQFLHPSRVTHTEDEAASQAVQKCSDSLALRSQLQISPGLLEGVHYVRTSMKHPSGLEMGFRVDTYIGGQARLMDFVVPINLAQYRTQK